MNLNDGDAHLTREEEELFNQEAERLIQEAEQVTQGASVLDAPVSPHAPLPGRRGADLLDAVRDHLGTYVYAPEDDLDLLTIWAAHTHLAEATYTTPRLLLDSPVPGSGKTTVLEHLERLCVNGANMSSITSDAMLARLIDGYGLATLLIDEADRALSPEQPGIKKLLAVINSGYKVGGSRPVSIPDGDGGWTVKKMSTFSPIVMAGNAPALPADTLSRTVRVLLLPDEHGDVDESDWEVIDGPTRGLGDELAAWAETVHSAVAEGKGKLPGNVRVRRGECWHPLKRVALAAGGRWPEVVDRLVLRDKEELEFAKEDGLSAPAPPIQLLQDLAVIWPTAPDGELAPWVSTVDLIAALVRRHPERWSARSTHGAELNAHRVGRMLTGSFRVSSTRPDSHGSRGYALASFALPWRSMRIEAPVAKSAPAPARLCDDCGNPLPPAAASGGFTVHPTCGGDA